LLATLKYWWQMRWITAVVVTFDTTCQKRILYSWFVNETDPTTMHGPHCPKNHSYFDCINTLSSMRCLEDRL